MSESTQGKWLGRSLDNYKEMHKDTARDKGVSDAFQKATTLTKARSILFGVKAKKYVATREKTNK